MQGSGDQVKGARNFFNEASCRLKVKKLVNDAFTGN